MLDSCITWIDTDVHVGRAATACFEDLMAVLDASGEDLRFVISPDADLVEPMREDPAAMLEAARLIHGLAQRAPGHLYGSCCVNVNCPEDALSSQEERKGDQKLRECARRLQCIWVCELEGRLVGSIEWFMDEEEKVGEIGNNGLDPDFTGRGLGTTMYRAVLDHFRRQGMRYAKVRTGLDEGHAPARRAHERLGFTIRHESVLTGDSSAGVSSYGPCDFRGLRVIWTGPTGAGLSEPAGARGAVQTAWMGKPQCGRPRCGRPG